MKHAPSPWSVKDRSANYHTRIIDARGHDVARISPAPDRTVGQENEIAELLKVSPQMLKILTELLEIRRMARERESIHSSAMASLLFGRNLNRRSEEMWNEAADVIAEVTG